MLKNLQNISLFHNLDKDILSKLSLITTEQKFDEGDEIFKEGSLGDALFIILDGEVEIRKLISKEEEKYKTLAILSDGDFFGEMALFDQKLRSASANCTKQATLLKIKGDDFQKLLHEDTKSASNVLSSFISVISERLRQTSRELVTLYETGKIIGEKENISSLSKKILKQILFAIPQADAGAIAIFNEFTDEYEILAQEGYVITEEDKIIHKNEKLILEIANLRKAILISNFKDDEKNRFYFGSSIILSPLLVMNKILGVIVITSKSKGKSFTSDNLNLVFAVASQVASALQNVKHLQEEEDRKRLKRVFVR